MMRTPWRSPPPSAASSCAPRWPVLTTTSRKPARANARRCCSIKVRSPTLSRGLGVVSVRGRMRSPRPAASIMAFIAATRRSHPLGLLLAKQQGLHRLARRFVVIKHLADLLGDGHLHMMAGGETLYFARGMHAFRNLLHRGTGLRQGLSTRQREADPAIARLVVGTGEHQIAEPGEAHESIAVPAHGDTEAHHLGESARDQRGPAVGAEAEPVGEAGGARQHSFDGTAQLHAGDVIAGIGAG